MKKNILTAVIILMATFTTVAQNARINISLGWAGEAFKGRIESLYNNNNDNSTVRIQHPEFSLGKGFQIQISGGYFLNDYWGFELGISYLKGNKTSFNQKNVILGVSQNSVIDVYGNLFSLRPAIIFRGNPDSRLVPYIKTGPAIGFVKQYLHYETEIEGGAEPRVLKEDWEYSGKASIGIGGELGLGYKINEKAMITLSFFSTAMIYKPEERHLTSAVLAGNPIGDNYEPYKSQVEYVEWTDDPYNSPPPDPSKALKAQAENFSYGQIGILAGLAFSF